MESSSKRATINSDTTGVQPGNYTISASIFLPVGEVDPTPSENNAVDGVVTVLPAPVLTVSPTSGPAGTKVIVHGSGFPTQFSPYGPSFDYILVTFDDNQLAFTLTQTGSFNLT